MENTAQVSCSNCSWNKWSLVYLYFTSNTTAPRVCSSTRSPAWVRINGDAIMESSARHASARPSVPDSLMTWHDWTALGGSSRSSLILDAGLLIHSIYNIVYRTLFHHFDTPKKTGHCEPVSVRRCIGLP